MDGSTVQPHGGDLGVMSALFPDAFRPWIDLSTGINPWPYPLPALDPALWARLPSASDAAALQRAAMAAYGVADPDAILAAPGSQVLINGLPFLRPPGDDIAIVGPTYGEHQPAWARAGHRVRMITDLPDPAGPLPDVLLLVNPNNPDGRTHDPARLLPLLEALACRGGWMLVDEAFCDLRPDLSLAALAGRRGLLVLRSFGKFYGLGGLRLGFLLAPPDLVRAVSGRFGPWAVSGPALVVGATALSDQGWQKAMRRRLAQAMARSLSLYQKAGVELIGGTDLYALIRTRIERDLYRELGQAGLLARSFRDRPGLLRLGLPPDSVAMDRLTKVLIP
ncbi:threonine-phosphate decarboxylase [Niveispirillum lacus]|uniref:threonine-phosphate decarboxylase n=1 Tax=Niveispirillum lacus TaxID=1981099 RepID=A0A255YRI5_9PROT|nr:threonine-phosphate decarboxylase CobD [Niveispirillum lacus]OYQ31801.1 threonine-phosphate decarboxylase [Niveispirillum lacus]